MWQLQLEPWWSFRVELALPVYLQRIFMF